MTDTPQTTSEPLAFVATTDLPPDPARAVDPQLEQKCLAKNCLAYLSPGGARTIAASGDGFFVIVDGKLELALRTPSSFPRFAFLPDGEHALVESKDVLYRVQLATGDTTPLLDGLYSTRCLDVSAEGTLAWVGMGELRLYDSVPDGSSTPAFRTARVNHPDLAKFVFGGRGLVVAETERDLPTAVLGIQGRAVKLLGQPEQEIAGIYAHIYEAAGRCLALPNRYQSGTGFELRGFEAAWQAAFAQDDRDELAQIDLENDW